MFMRVDRLITELPPPKKQDPNAGAALQELLGGKYGEMSTLGNYMFQSFNFRSKDKLRPFYSLVASITAEELAHVERCRREVGWNWGWRSLRVLQPERVQR
jgi:Mn-containing catalase